MVMDLAADQGFEQYVSTERGEISRVIFSDEEIFEREMEQIFGRAWLFLCHESQIPKKGDFFEAPMGRDNVLVVRQKDGSVKGLVNTCTHRGNAVCRAEEGNAKAFLCTYHGWSFGIDGSLISVPGFEELYGGDLDREGRGLAEVAQLETYRGFVFATMDPSAPPLAEYLGLTGRLGLDLIAQRGDMEVIPGIQKFVIDCNWKFAVDNLFDFYHPLITHKSALDLNMFPVPEDTRAAQKPLESGSVTQGGSDLELSRISGADEIVCLGEFGHAIGGPLVDSETPQVGFFDESWRELPETIEQMGELGSQVGGHPNIFPSCWVAGTVQISLRVPVSPTQTEIWWYTFVDRNAAPELRESHRMFANHIFGPAGALEQEDGENWSQSTRGTHGFRSRQVTHLLGMDLGKGEIECDERGMAYITGTTNEHAQLWTYKSWAAWMDGLDWDDLRTVTTPTPGGRL